MTQAEIRQEIRKVQVWIYNLGAPLQVLLFRTNPQRGSFWQPVTGGVDPGETFEQGALREAREESGIHWPESAPLFPLGGFEFAKPGVPARFVEQAFALEAPALEQPRLDPREHVEARWMEPEEALSLLKFPSNADMLRRMLERLRSGTAPLLLLASLFVASLLLPTSPAFAVQTALVIGSQVQVHEAPRADSPVLDRLEGGKRIDVSSGTVADAEGDRWNKVRIGEKRFGYVRAHEIKTQELDEAIREHDRLPREDGEPERATPEGYEWTFTARAMGLVGGGSGHADGLQAGGEGELSFSPLFNKHGYLRRMLGVGAVYQKFTDDRVVAATFIYRIFAETRGEPEVRVRIGQALDSEKTVGGVNLAYRYPLTLARVRYLAAYAEAGALTSVSGGSSTQYFWGAAGLGFQF